MINRTKRLKVLEAKDGPELERMVAEAVEQLERDSYYVMSLKCWTLAGGGWGASIIYN